MINKLFLAALIFATSALSGCTVLDYKSTKTETTAPAATTESVDKGLEEKVIELERRVKILEEKLQGQW